ncbi:DUF3939 domain-containing protein [Aquibacillus halophilus]|uniref:DUF3939 domain-containing protein n=1 Tax=Aquibacillus halophilus TaxID=930132 RepID=A0A6A8DI30_9BACI|nr:DUF3939 domain-containing protein [Aquibacillus halophilus]MRH44166.1 DUF3939 domain-containing protein [Aquibacillus halophilus]
MWGKNKKSKQQPKPPPEYETRDIPLFELQKAIHKYSDQLPSEVPLSIIINEDLTLDYKLLAPILKGIPQQTYYMTRETYELFEEKDYQLALDIDMIQKAVDNYMQQTKELPIINGDPYKKVSMHKLEKLNLLDHRPDQTFFITNEEYLVTHKSPKK